MSKRSKSLIGAAWAVLVMVALTFGATQVMAAPISACTGPGEIGTCPPFDNAICREECINQGHDFGGECFHGCCTCLL